MATTLRRKSAGGQVSAITDGTRPEGSAWESDRHHAREFPLGLASAGMARCHRGMPDVTGALWWIAVLTGSLCFIWQSWRAGGWEKLKRTKFSRWMAGEDDAHL